MQAHALDLIQRIVDAIEDCQTKGEINPYAFFSHHKLSNWLNDAKAILDQTQGEKL